MHHGDRRRASGARFGVALGNSPQLVFPGQRLSNTLTAVPNAKGAPFRKELALDGGSQTAYAFDNGGVVRGNEPSKTGLSLYAELTTVIVCADLNTAYIWVFCGPLYIHWYIHKLAFSCRGVIARARSRTTSLGTSKGNANASSLSERARLQPIGRGS